MTKAAKIHKTKNSEGS